MVIALLLQLTALSSRGPLIDFDSKAAAVGQVLAKLSGQVGVKLRAAPKLAEEVVYVHAKQVDLPTLKAKLAEAMAGAWTVDGEFEVLTRTPALENKVWKDHVAYRRRLVDDALKDIQKKLAVAFDAKALAAGLSALPTEADVSGDMSAARRRYEMQNALFERGPRARLLDRLLLACNPDDLAAIGPYERRVFKVGPTALQRGFNGGKFKQAMAAYAIEQQAWNDEAAKANFKAEPEGRMASDPRGQIEPGAKTPKFTLEVKRGEMTALLLVNLTGDTESGNQIMGQAALADPARKFLDGQMTPAEPVATDPVVSLSENSKEFESAMKDRFAGRGSHALSPRMKEMMLGVVTEDPLSWAVSDALNDYSKSKAENIVAVLPDSLLSTTFFISRERPLRVNAFMESLVQSGATELQSRDGWLEISPADRYEAKLNFTPRGSVVALMKSVFGLGRLDIRDYAKYAFDSKLLNRGGLGDWFLALYDPSVLGASDRTDWKCLQLYGSFSRREQASLEAGGQFAYGAMNFGQKSIVERIVFADRLSLDGDGFSDYRGAEPTEMFATGVPGDCVTSATVQKTPVIVAYARDKDGKTRPLRNLDPYTLATIETDMLGNPERMAAYGVANLAGYAIGADKILNLKIQISPRVRKVASITVPDYDANATPVAWDKLPEPFAKSVAGAIAQVKANKVGQPVRVNPPPSRG